MTRSKLKLWVPAIIVVAIVGAIFGYLGYNAIPLTKEHVIGTWHAVDGETGTATFNADGTFELQGMSLNPVTSYDAAGEFYATGTWQLIEREGHDSRLSVHVDSFGETQGKAVPDAGSIPIWVSSVVRNWQRALYFSDGEEVHTLVMVKD